MENTYKTLTPRQIMKLDKPGFYHLPFMNDDHDVEVVYATPNIDEVLMKVIIVRLEDDVLQDFYYNESDEVFKPLTVHEETLDLWLACKEDDETNAEIETAYHREYTMGYQWIQNEVGIFCPEEFADYEIPVNDYAWEM